MKVSFEGVGEQMIEQLLESIRREGAEVMLHGTGKAQLQIQQRGQGPGPLADLTDQFHNVPVLQRQRKAAAQPGGGGEVIDQPQGVLLVP